MITQEELKRLIGYNPDTGYVWWLHPGKGRGPTAGRSDYGKRGRIMIDGKNHLVYKIIWLYVYGVWPSEIDHINGDVSDNRLSNLRTATSTHNHANAKPRNGNANRGITWDKYSMKWKVAIGPANNRIQKSFRTYEEALAFAETKHKEIYGEFSFYNRRDLP